MRYDNEHKQRTHRKLIEEASAAIRLHGPDNISVAALMAKLGLTHGGFYAHFKSKDDLIAEAINYMLEERVKSFEKNLESASDISVVLTNYIDLYLSPVHRDTRDKGCAVVALNGDIARMSDDTKVRFELGTQKMLTLLSTILAKLNKPQPESLAASVLSEMAGAVGIARAMSSAEQSEWLLNNTREIVKARIGITT